MKRRNDSLVDALFVAPWWVSVFLSGIIYFTLTSVLPKIELHQSNPLDIAPLFFAGTANVLADYAALIALFFLIPAPFSAVRAFRARRSKRLRVLKGSTNLGQRKNVKDRSLEPALGANSETCERSVDLSAETFRKIEWYSFELLCKIFIENYGYRVVKTKAGADGGIDLIVYKEGLEQPHAVVQCKARSSQPVGIKHLRELLGAMTAEEVAKGIIITNSRFTDEAVEFTQSNSIETINANQLEALIDKFDDAKKERLRNFLETNDYTTPTCPNCEVKLVVRTARKGQAIGQRFWGCRNYPRCRYKMKMNNDEATRAL